MRIESEQWEAPILTRWSTKLRAKLVAVFRSLILFVAAIAYVVGSCDAAERTIAVACSDCRLAIEHAATADVVPADVGRSGVALPDIVSVFVSAEVRNTFQLGDDSPLLSFDAGIGVVEYELSSGRLLLNERRAGSGRLVSRGRQAALIAPGGMDSGAPFAYSPAPPAARR